MDGIKPGVRVLVQALAGAAVNLLKGTIDVQELVLLEVHQEENLPHILRHLAKPLLAFAEGVPDAFALGDINYKFAAVFPSHDSAK